MFVVRLVGLLVAVALGACVVLWLASGDRKWLRYGWNLFRVALAVVAVMLLLLFAERLVAL
ncbi:MAG TPA: hypothetical protein VK043_10805 [Burkholderiales bacterium]|nr:hypothetical protein [Burkholderiales bacterium]